MKIAFVTWEYPPYILGGGGIYAGNVISKLSESHQITVFVPEVSNIDFDNHKKNIKIEKIKINERIPFKGLQFWLRLPKVVREIHKIEKFDLIHFNGYSYGFLKKQIIKSPQVVTVHHLAVDAIKHNNLNILSRIEDLGSENSFLSPLIEKRYLESADKLIAVSNFTKNQIIKNYDIDSSKISVIYNGIDLEEINLKINSKNKSEVDLPNKPIILFVGRIEDPRKGLDLLLLAFSKVLKKKDAILVIIGEGNPDKIKKIGKKLDILKNLYFMGFVDEITLKQYYSMCNVYVCSSRLEGFGLTIIEAMAAGKPVVANNVGAIPELINNGVNGILIDLFDSQGMADAIIYYLEKNNLDKDIQKINTNYLRNHFSWQKNSNEIEKLYEDLVN